MRILITGAGGLIGWESSKFFLDKKAEVIGIDNNMRKRFFGKEGDVSRNLSWLKTNYDNFKNLAIDVRDRKRILRLFQNYQHFDLVIHAAAQPSHDWAAREPFTDFDINAAGTLNLLEGFRRYSHKGVFIFVSTNKVYGDMPNKVNLIELKNRYEYSKKQTIQGISMRGISEAMTIDNSTHSLFGASKVAADVLTQEYGRYFHLKTGIFRGGCLTGPQHSAVELHGFLTYIVHCALNKRHYRIFGYKGKQVRDQIHSRDVVRAFYEFYKKPKEGAVYNIGGGKYNSASTLEIIDILKKDFGLKLKYAYKQSNRIGDHICYYSDMAKFKRDYPRWGVKIKIHEIIEEILKNGK